MSQVGGIDFECQNCGHKLRVPAAFAGKKGNCLNCQAVLTVPASGAAKQPGALAVGVSGRVAGSDSSRPNPEVLPGKGGQAGPQRSLSALPDGTPAKTSRPGSGSGSDSPGALTSSASDSPRQGTLRFNCPECKHLMLVPAQLAGRRGVCKCCGAVVTVPQSARSQGPASSSVAADPKRSEPKRLEPRVVEPLVGDLNTAAKTSPAPAMPGLLAPANQGKGAAKAPAASAATSPGKGTARRPANFGAELLAKLPEEVEIEPTAISYRIASFFVVFLLLLIPVLYLAFIAAIAFGVYYYAVNCTWILSLARGRGAVLVFLAYLAPIVGGGFSVLFMLKPFFARREHVDRSRRLTEQGEPLLFSFVYRICDSVGAPRPTEILVDVAANASAGYGGGGWLSARQLQLTVGANLIEGLTISQFGGVLAHEFGHLSQGTGMRLSYMIRVIAQWLGRMVYERDEIDAWLAAQTPSEGETSSLSLFFMFIQLMVYLSRCVLWIFFLIGIAGAGILLRQMEYDADKFEIAFSGSKTFNQSMKKVVWLGAFEAWSHRKTVEWMIRGSLPDDLVALARHYRQNPPPELTEAVKEIMAEEQASIFSTHPSPAARVAASNRINADGAFHDDRPAQMLFSGFDQLCRNTTWDFYRSIFGQPIPKDKLRTVAELFEEDEKLTKSPEFPSIPLDDADDPDGYRLA